MERFLSLADIPTGESCIVTKVHGYGGFRNRVIELGFVRGVKVKVIKNAPLKDPIEYAILDIHISLRRSEARLIQVERVAAEESDVLGAEALRGRHGRMHGKLWNVFSPRNRRLHHLQERRATRSRHGRGAIRETFEERYSGTFMTDTTPLFSNDSNTINVALVGNPNCGKTTLFNRATGAHEKVGNYSGVTVGAAKGSFRYKHYTINFIDLPGTYSINEYSPEEKYVREFLMDKHPDIVLNIVNAVNIERNLFLTTQIIDLNVRMVMALNMYDELEKNGSVLDYRGLGRMLGFPIVPTVASKGIGMEELFETLVQTFEDKAGMSRHIHINYGSEIERAVGKVKTEIDKNGEIVTLYHTRNLAINLLEGVESTRELLFSQPGTADGFDPVRLAQVVSKETERLEREYRDDVRTIIASAKYGFIHGALAETLRSDTQDKQRLSSAIDVVLTHQWLGIPVLLFFIWIIFQATFTLGQYPADWIETGVGALGQWVGRIMPDGQLRDLLVDGVIGGVGAVIVFLPNILLLFLFISFMEESGYMARAAFIMDRFMHRIGLHGKSFISLLLGFGCNVPAMMSTRTLASRKDRILTMLIIPFMSCSARIPVYILFVSAFFAKQQGLILLSVYLIGVLVAVAVSLVLRKIILTREEAPFVMELPPYRVPTVRNIAHYTWEKVSQYLSKMGKLILFASIIIWALGYYPRYDAEKVRPAPVSAYEASAHTLQLENSYIGRLGRAVEPAIEPLGFDWKMGIGLIAGVGAKEIVVSSFGVLYNVEDAEESGQDQLVQAIRQDRYTSGPKAGQLVYSPLVAYSFMIFVLLYFPCLAAVAAIGREAGWRWAVFAVIYTTAVAWVVSFLIYQIGSLF